MNKLTPDGGSQGDALIIRMKSARSMQNETAVAEAATQRTDLAEANVYSGIVEAQAREAVAVNRRSRTPPSNGAASLADNWP